MDEGGWVLVRVGESRWVLVRVASVGGLNYDYEREVTNTSG